MDPLEARLLLLEDSQGERQLWVSLDLVGVACRTSFQMRQDLAMQTGIRFEAIVVNCVHTHSGPMTNADKYAAHIDKPPALQAYEESLIQMVLEAAATAGRSMQAVAVSVHKGESRIGINRRNRDADGEMSMRPNANGLCNPDLWVLNLIGESGRAVVYSYGCHPVLVYGFAWNALSADWVGVSRRQLATRLGEGSHCQFIQGMAGNVRPRIVSDFETNSFRAAKPEDVDKTGLEIAADVLATLESGGEGIDLDLLAAAGHVLVTQDREHMPTIDHWRELGDSEDELNRYLGEFWSGRLERGLSPSQAVYFDVGLLQLAKGHRIAWLAGEPVAEWMGILRSGLEDENLTTWGYCQDVPCYLPTDCLLPEKGYEVEMSRWYNKDGPSPFVEGIDETVLSEMRRLESQL